MYIIDKNTDYYDFLSSPNMYGTDKKVVYDRRGSEILTDILLARIVYSPYSSLARIVYSPYSSLAKQHYFLLLEVGFKQYIIEVTNIKFKKDGDKYSDILGCDFKRVYTFTNNLPTHHYPEYPISIREVQLEYVRGKKGREPKYKLDKLNTYSFTDIVTRAVDRAHKLHPILKETSLTSLFTPEEIWVDVQTYLSSLHNDEDRETDLTDEERAEKNGFDRNTSFRNPIK